MKESLSSACPLGWLLQPAVGWAGASDPPTPWVQGSRRVERVTLCGQV